LHFESRFIHPVFFWRCHILKVRTKNELLNFAVHRANDGQLPSSFLFCLLFTKTKEKGSVPNTPGRFTFSRNTIKG
jgi:hypothetical protein